MGRMVTTALKLSLLVIGLSSMANTISAQTPAPSDELNTILMHSTFRITGPLKGDPTKISFGTIFILGIPLKDDPKHAYSVLVTAAHVLDDIGADNATLLMRRRGSPGTYSAF